MTDLDRHLPALEALIFSSGEPCTVTLIRRALPSLTPGQIAEAVERINQQLKSGGRPYEITAVDGGYQFRTRAEFGGVISAAQPERKVRLSKAALETLAIIAYRQPLTRAEVEDLRCVDCGAVIRSLLERDLIRISGRRDVPGRPALYATTSAFLQTFGLPSLREMPALRELEVQQEESGTPGLGAPVSEVEEDSGAENVDAAVEAEALQTGG